MVVAILTTILLFLVANSHQILNTRYKKTSTS